jgi:hypothetical protein
MSCINVVEVVNVSKVSDVQVCNIIGLAFVFLESDVNEYVYHVEGMQEAYIIWFKYSPILDELCELKSTNFYSFPDLS